MKEPKNLNTADALEFLKSELKRMQEQPRGDLQDMDLDTAFEMGYKVCIADLEACTRKQ